MTFCHLIRCYMLIEEPVKNRESQIQSSIVLIILSLVIALALPITIISLGDSIVEENKVQYFQYSCVVIVLCSFVTQQLQKKAFDLLCPHSSFEPPECFELRKTYHGSVMSLEKIWKFLAIVSIVVGGAGGYIAEYLIIAGLY